MRKTILILITACLLSGCAARGALTDGRTWIDLGYSYSSQTIYWPTDEDFKLEPVFAGMTDKGYYYSSYKYGAEEHGGTHFDAPVHFAEGGRTVDQIPLEQLMGPAVVVDVSGKAAVDRDYQISARDFRDWEAANGPIPEGAIVMLNTGNGKYWPDRKKYTGTDLRGKEGVANLHFPGLHRDGAEFLATRKIKAVGIDTSSIDYGQSTMFEAHRLLFAKDLVVFENVANLDKLPAKGAWVIALPMNIEHGSGSPLRIIARPN